MKNLKRTRKLLLTTLSILVLILGLIFVFKEVFFPIVVQNEFENIVKEEDEYKWAIDLYDENKKINDDYVGHIIFDSKLIDLAFVQSQKEDIMEAYDEYLRTDWQTMEYLEEGSVFLDPQNSLQDQNIVLYGHYVYPHLDPSGTKMFTPLHELKDKKNYAEHKYISLVLYDEVRRYEIAHVYYVEIDVENAMVKESGMEYMLPSFDDEALTYYLGRVDDLEFYDTGIEITSDDHFLTLQTCVENRDDLRLIAIAKEIEIIEIR